jgi:PAS domain S-box-containing protein
MLHLPQGSVPASVGLGVVTSQLDWMGIGRHEDRASRRVRWNESGSPGRDAGTRVLGCRRMSGKLVEPLQSGSVAAFRALFEQEAFGVSQFDAHGRFLAANDCMARMLGYSADDLLGLTLAEITHPKDRPATRDCLSSLREGGTSRALEAEYLRKDGQAVWGIIDITVVRNDAGEIASFLAFVRDATERKRIDRDTAFLDELTVLLGSAREEQDIVRTALSALGGYWGVSRLYFAEGNEAENRVLVSGQRMDEAPRDFTATLALQQLGGQAWWRDYSRGDVAVENALEQVGLPPVLGGSAARSYAVQALERADGWRVTLTVVADAPRAFRSNELHLLGALLGLVWPLVERARTEATLEAELKAIKALLVERHRSEVPRPDLDDGVARITAESELRHRLYETILAGTPDLIYVFDLQHRFIYANAALLYAWNRSLRGVIGKTCLDIGYPDWQAAMHDSEIDQVVATKQTIRGEVPFKTLHGERIHDYIFVPVIGADGEVEAIAGTTRDVTSLKQAEDLTAGQAHALELMVKGAPLPEVLEALCDVIDRQATSRLRTSILLMQDDGRHLRPAAGRHMPVAWSRAMDPWPVGPESGGCGTAAYRRETVISADIARDPLWKGLRELAEQHGVRACWSTPIFSSGGSVLGTLALYYSSAHEPDASERRLVDVITRTAGIAIERKRGEEGTKTHSERLRLLWETAAVLLTADEPEALVRALFGRIAPHLQIDVVLNYAVVEGGDGFKLFYGDGISAAHAAEFSVIAADSALSGEVTRSHEPYSVSHIQRSDDARSAPMRAMGLRTYACFPLNADERVLGLLAVGSRARDDFEVDELEFLRTVTRYMTVAYERLRLVRELREADRKKDDFIALLAHELRNPLAPLRSGLHVMRMAAHDSAAVARARTIMERQLSHMVRLIDDLLDVSRISLNKLQLRRSRVTLAEIVANAVETARPVIDRAEHHLEVILPPEPVLLDADLTRLAQVLGNLLTNAGKFTPKRGHITLTAELQGDTVLVAVGDDGIGLRPESLNAIFDMFSQVDHSVERSTGGLGIGLALVRGLTEMHGGSVRADSAGLGRGSRFSVRLPVVITSQEERVQILAPTMPDAPRRRILVADDNRDAVESLATMLRLSGNDVHTASDGIEAVALAEQLVPDVVLMDIGMPRLNGREATRRIRDQAWGKGMVVIALTGWGQESDRRLSREAGCDEHLVKPVDFAELERLMAELCVRAPDASAAALLQECVPTPESS